MEEIIATGKPECCDNITSKNLEEYKQKVKEFVEEEFEFTLENGDKVKGHSREGYDFDLI